MNLRQFGSQDAMAAVDRIEPTVGAACNDNRRHALTAFMRNAHLVDLAHVALQCGAVLVRDAEQVQRNQLDSAATSSLTPMTANRRRSSIVV